MTRFIGYRPRLRYRQCPRIQFYLPRFQKLACIRSTTRSFGQSHSSIQVWWISQRTHRTGIIWLDLASKLALRCAPRGVCCATGIFGRLLPRIRSTGVSSARRFMKLITRIGVSAPMGPMNIISKTVISKIRPYVKFLTLIRNKTPILHLMTGCTTSCQVAFIPKNCWTWNGVKTQTSGYLGLTLRLNMLSARLIIFWLWQIWTISSWWEISLTMCRIISSNS
jgi:hypothetical protein